MGDHPLRATLARRLTFTPELLANVRQRFEHSDEPLPSMAADLGCCKTTLHKIAKREGWVRYVRSPRDLSPAARLEARAEALACSLHPPLEGEGRSSEPTGPREARPDDRLREGERGGVSSQERSPPPDPPSLELRRVDLPPPGEAEERETVEELHALVRKELDVFKAERAQLKGLPLGLLERERSARTLSSLVGTLHKVQAMRCGVPQSGSDHDYDDIPADIDEFRRELARRINAFVASRMDPGGAGEDGAGPAAAAE